MYNKRRIIFLILIIIVSILFIGCEKKEQNTSEKKVDTGAENQDKNSIQQTNLPDKDLVDNDSMEPSNNSGISTANESNDYGAKGAMAKEKFSLQEMLIYGIQDEYSAKAEYEKIMEVFRVDRPFANIVESEKSHIALLQNLFLKNKFQIPLDISANYVVVPKTLSEAYDIGIKAEIANIAMYEKFLEQEDLPDDAKDVFVKLRDGSQNHLEAFRKSRNK